MKKKVLALLLALILVTPAGLVLAADTSDAIWTGRIDMTNNATDTATDVLVPFSVNTSSLITNHDMAANASNSAIISSSGTEVPYQPAPTGNMTWIAYIPTIAGNTVLSSTLYVGGSTDMNSSLAYFPGSAGMTTGDAPGIDPGNQSGNISGSHYGRFDPDVAGNITGKEDAINLEGDGSGNITLTYQGLSGQTTTLRPNAAGDETNIASRSGCAANWDCVNDTSDATAVYETNSVYQRDLYEIDEPSTTVGTISSVVIYFRIGGGDADSDTQGTPHFKIDGTVYTGTARTAVGGPSETFSQTYGTNPDTSAAWTWDDLTDLQIGASIRWTGVDATVSYLRDVWIVVNWTTADVSISASGVAAGERLIQWFIIPGGSTILRPTANTSDLEFPTIIGGVESWDAVNDVTPDEDATYLQNTGVHSNWVTDYFEAEDLPFMGGNITNVQVTVRHRQHNGNYYHRRASIRLDDVVTNGGTDSGVNLNWLDLTATFSSPPGGGTWTWDKVNRLQIGGALQKNAAPDGHARITQIYMTVNYQNNMSLAIDGTVEATDNTTLLFLDNANDWISYTNGVMPYVYATNMTVNQSQVQAIIWQNTTGNFTDLTGNGHDATPTFNLAASDADVSASLVSFGPVSEAQAPAYAVDDPTDFVTTASNVSAVVNPVTPSPTTFPLKDLIEAVASASATPAQLPFTLIATFLILAVSLAFSGMMRNLKAGSNFLKTGIIIVLFAIAIGLDVFDLWMLIFYVIFALALSMGSMQRRWG